MAVVHLSEPDPKPAEAYEDVMTADILLRKAAEQGFGTEQPDVYSIAEYLGLEVSEEIMDRDMSGYLEFRNNRWIAGVNILHHPNRRRFTLAHEIGHYVLHRNRKFEDRGDFFTRRNEHDSLEETQANSFAAELLMPEKQVREKVSSGVKSLSELADYFGVSFSAMKFRVKELGYKVK